MTLSVMESYVQCYYAECYYAEYHKLALYAECHYAECRYVECCGAKKVFTILKITYELLTIRGQCP
jgi:hypothetical protein